MRIKEKYKCYSSWCSMLTRCRNKNRNTWSNYGGRGIKVCKSWTKFKNFLSDMGDRPRGYSIDRIDPNGNYCKENCRWIKRTDQSRTTRKYLLINKCLACGIERGNRKGRCHKCNEFFRRHGAERPPVGHVTKHRISELRKKSCLKCAKKLFWDERKPIKGLCNSCYLSKWNKEKKEKIERSLTMDDGRLKKDIRLID